MSYLYGDSTPSDLNTNFIELLKRAVDASVAIVRVDLSLCEGRERRAAREARNDAELVALEAVVDAVGKSLESVSREQATPASRLADSIGRWALEAARTERDKARGSLAADLAAIDEEASKLRAECVKALEALVLRHDLPDAESSWHVGKNGARLSQTTPYGLAVSLTLDLPDSSPLSHDLRVDRLLEGVEISAPEAGGVFRKQVRLVPHKLGKHHVVDVLVTPAVTRLELRETLEPGAHGFDVEIRGGKLSVTRLAKDGETPISEATDAEVAKFVELDGKVRAAVAELAGRKSLVEAKLDGQPVVTLERPILVVERLVAAMAPTVAEIAKHSLTPGEFVLKRMLGDDRREEIFVSARELKAKLESLPESSRSVFAPLGLAEPARVAPALAAGSARPDRATSVDIIIDVSPPPPPARSARPPTSELTDADVVESVDANWLPPPLPRG